MHPRALRLPPHPRPFRPPCRRSLSHSHARPPAGDRFSATPPPRQRPSWPPAAARLRSAAVGLRARRPPARLASVTAIRPGPAQLRSLLVLGPPGDGCGARAALQDCRRPGFRPLSERHRPAELKPDRGSYPTSNKAQQPQRPKRLGAESAVDRPRPLSANGCGP